MTTTTEHLAKVVSSIGNPKVLIVGDIMLDRYIWGDAERVSPEAPVLVLRADEEDVRLGGAGSVAALLQALEGRAILAGMIGNDVSGRVLRALLTETGIDDSVVFCDENRPTTCKDRFMGRASHRHPNQILRVDREACHPLTHDVECRFLASVTARLDQADILLISDYAKGVCTPKVLKELIERANVHGVPVFVDPARISDYRRYQGATLLVPNRAEAETVLGRPIRSGEDAHEAGKQLILRYGIPNIITKLDRDGMTFVDVSDRCIHAAAQPRSVYDVTGAGDMVLAALGLCRASGLRWDDALQIANVAAGLEVERQGVSPVKREEILSELLLHHTTRKIGTRRSIVSIANGYRRCGKRIIFSNGCFDLLHVGHIGYLQQAKRLGDVLIVAINSDASVRRLKGPSRPIIGEIERATTLAALECVDHVIVFDDDTPHSLLDEVRPDVLVKGGTYSVDEVVGREIVTRYGGTVTVLGVWKDASTTGIIQNIMARRAVDMRAIENHASEPR